MVPFFRLFSLRGKFCALFRLTGSSRCKRGILEFLSFFRLFLFGCLLLVCLALVVSSPFRAGTLYCVLFLLYGFAFVAIRFLSAPFFLDLREVRLFSLFSRLERRIVYTLCGPANKISSSNCKHPEGFYLPASPLFKETFSCWAAAAHGRW